MTRYTRNSRLTAKATGDPGLPFLYLALPVMDEADLLRRLLHCITEQTYQRFKLFVCVNQPDTWWNHPDKVSVCESNQESIRLLNEYRGIDIEIIDRSSKEKGWTGKRHGVGYARKTIMDRINTVAQPGDVIVSLDADSVFSSNYLHSIAGNFFSHPGSTALAVPYFHKTPDDPSAARAMLRYEIYMRHYFLNLHRIGSPYAFTALGSAMALPVWAYRAIGGMTPKLSGEDFYFLQKLRKYGEVLLWNEEVVHPEARFSDRVFFGTGPAMIKGAAGDWTSYPVYPAALFDDILETYDILDQLYGQPADTPVVRFMSEVFKEADPLQPIRVNHRDPEHFKRGFHEKFDGLRILQYLKCTNEANPGRDEENLWDYFARFFDPRDLSKINIRKENFSFSGSPVEELEAIRMFLYEQEMKARFTSTPH